MRSSLENARPLRELATDSSGQLVVEWALVTATVVIPLGTLGLMTVHLLDIYFYRFAGVIALPFP